MINLDEIPKHMYSEQYESIVCWIGMDAIKAIDTETYNKIVDNVRHCTVPYLLNSKCPLLKKGCRVCLKVKEI